MLGGLHPFEVAMLIAGSLLFLVTLVLFAILTAKGKPTKNLILFFAVSVVMIGFPAYSKIEINGNGITLEKDTNDLLQHPTDPALREKVASDVATLSSRPLQDPKLLTTLARAQIALGDDRTAAQNIDKALQNQSQYPAAIELKKRLQLDTDLQSLATQVERNPGDQAAKTRLNQVVSETNQLKIASPSTIANLARAHAALGNEREAQENVDKVLKINPSFAPALELRQKINSGVH